MEEKGARQKVTVGSEWDSPVHIVECIDRTMDNEVKEQVLHVARRYDVDIDEQKLAEVIRGDQERYIRAYKEGYEAGYRRCKEDMSKEDLSEE